jgi:hypothetical protein
VGFHRPLLSTILVKRNMPENDDYQTIFERYSKAEMRYQYFLLGTTMAILAFSAQYGGRTSIPNLKWLMPFSWGALLVSFLSGLVRARTMVRVRMLDVAPFLGMEPQKRFSQWARLNKRAIWALRVQNALLVLGLVAYALFHTLNYLLVPTESVR